MYRKRVTKPVPKSEPALPPFAMNESYKTKIQEGSYIGKKGYTIPKSLLEPRDIEFLYKDLFMVPVKHGPAFGGDAAENASFPVYRENTNKIYLPRFYGIERYGYPLQERELNLEGVEAIDCVFDKPLRDYQETIVGTYMDNVQKTPQHNVSGGIITIGCGKGKCLAKDTPILMYDGTIKMVQDVVIGDQLMGDDSTPRNVLSLARGRETMYKVCSKKGGAYIVNESHILSLKYGTPQGTVLDISVLDYLALPESYHGSDGSLYGYRVPVVFPEKPVEMEPYLVGYWFGDEHSFSTQESYVIKSMFQNKHIPLHYKCNSRQNQLALLAGLIDSAGYYHDNGYEIIQQNEVLLDDIVYLARSLGFAAYKKNLQTAGTYYKIEIYGPGLEDIPVRCPRKKGHPQKQNKDVLNYRIWLEKLPEDDYYGFEIDGNRRFVLGDFTVTHNTVMAIKIISKVAKKTLVIVHKEFLLNQWVERIREFLPTARIGRIQGPVFDVEGKDIVIGMLQTLYDRDFPVDAFDSFGLTVVDEVHRIGSCQFSKALLRIQTPYMLGVTATLERKDGLTKVIHYFIGPTVYADGGTSGKVEDGTVLVRGMEFMSRDVEFNEVATDFRGNPMFSTMITKLCAHGPRTRFLVDILDGLVKETPEAQILVLGHNRSLLTDLYDAIVGREIATVGYYVGGMKQRDLDASTEKQIILASYAMASEGFDHKNLSILVMVTPKTDIIQSVGRIFRQKHARPLIVDVVDKHDIFQNQWRKRRAYYKKCGYRIQMTTNLNPTEWKTVFEPKLPGIQRITGNADDCTDEAESQPEIKGCMIQLDKNELND